jgi:hypothetical protein
LMNHGWGTILLPSVTAIRGIFKTHVSCRFRSVIRGAQRHRPCIHSLHAGTIVDGRSGGSMRVRAEPRAVFRRRVLHTSP